MSLTASVQIREAATKSNLRPETDPISSPTSDTTSEEYKIRAEAGVYLSTSNPSARSPDGSKEGCGYKYRLTDTVGAYCPRVDATHWDNETMTVIEQVFMEFNIYNAGYFREIHLKGNPVQPWWITSFKIEASDDRLTWIPINNGQPIQANVDQDTLFIYQLDPSFIAYYIKVIPVTWHGYPSWRGAAKYEAVKAWITSMSKQTLKITASSTQLPECSLTQIDLSGSSQGTSGWCPSDAADPTKSWLQFEWPTPELHESLMFMGHKVRNETITLYSLNHSMDGVTWTSIPEVGGLTSHRSAWRKKWAPPFTAKFIRIIPVKINTRASCRVEFSVRNQTEYDRLGGIPKFVEQAPVEQAPVEVATGIDGMIAAIGTGADVTYSSINDNCQGGAHLNAPEGWCVQTMKDPTKEYLQIKAAKAHDWTAIQTSGRRNADQWITKYKIQTSADGALFTDYNGGAEITANTDRNTPVVHLLDPPISGAMAIRIVPLGYQLWAAMRIEAYYAPEEVDTTDITTTYVDPRIEIMRKINEFLKQFGSDVTLTNVDINNYDFKLNIA